MKLLTKRAILGSQLFLASFISYLIRACFSIQIVAMVKRRTGLATNFDFGPRYDWSDQQQGRMVGGYYMGYTFGSFYAGWVCENYNTVHVLAITIFAQGLLMGTIPCLADIHWSWILINRMMCGILGSFLFPACNTLISRWTPPNERSLMLSCLLGGSFGSLALWLTLGHFIPSIGWVYSWHVLALIVCASCLPLTSLCYPRPADHPTITTTEREYIENSLIGLHPHTTEIITPPYKEISKNKAFYSWVFLQFGNDWGLTFFINMAPLFFVDGLGFDAKYAGALATAPSVCRCLFGIVFGIIGNYVRRNQIWHRKEFILFSHILPGMLMFLVTYCSRNYPGCSVGLLSLALGFNGASVLTNISGPQDLSPNYAGSLCGYANGITSVCSALASFAVSQLFTGRDNKIENWQKLFFVGAISYWISGLQFMFFGEVEEQPFNNLRYGDVVVKNPTRKIALLAKNSCNEKKFLPRSKPGPGGAAPTNTPTDLTPKSLSQGMATKTKKLVSPGHLRTPGLVVCEPARLGSPIVSRPSFSGPPSKIPGPPK